MQCAATCGSTGAIPGIPPPLILPPPILQAVPYEMSLASVKRFLWRKGDDLVFHFRAGDPRRPLQLPHAWPLGLMLPGG